MPDGNVALHGGQRLLVEDLAHQPQVLEDQYLGAVGDGDAGSFLSAVLQRVQAVVGELGDFLAGGPHSEYAALFAGGILEFDRFVGHVAGCSLRRGG